MANYDAYGRAVLEPAQALVSGGSDVHDAVVAGLHIAGPHQASQHGQYAVVPKDAKLESLEPLLGDLARPSRIRQTVTFFDAGSFTTYVNRFKDAATLVLGDEKAAQVRAVLDFHESASEPRWGSHVAVFACRHTPAWVRWTERNGKRMNQTDFATFLEDNLVDIAAPEGALLLEMAKNFEVKKDVAFASAIRLDNGQVQLTYNEDVQGTSRKGEMRIPFRFVLALAPFEGVEPYRVDARLRYRMADGKLAVWFDLLRVEDYLRDAFKAITDFVKAQTGFVVLSGELGK